MGLTNGLYVLQQAFLKKEQERKEAELLAEKQEALRKRKEEKRIAREVKLDKVSLVSRLELNSSM